MLRFISCIVVCTTFATLRAHAETSSTLHLNFCAGFFAHTFIYLSHIHHPSEMRGGLRISLDAAVFTVKVAAVQATWSDDDSLFLRRAAAGILGSFLYLPLYKSKWQGDPYTVTH